MRLSRLALVTLLIMPGVASWPVFGQTAVEAVIQAEPDTPPHHAPTFGSRRQATADGVRVGTAGRVMVAVSTKA
jgi:hypothetical protein